MKINSFTSVVALCLSILIAYGFYSLSEHYSFIIGMGSFILLLITLFFMIGVQFNYKRGINIKATSLLFFAATIAINFIFCFITLSVSAYFISSGIIFMLYLLIIYYLLKPKEI